MIFSSPVKDIVVTNDRWGKETMCKKGGILTCMDRYNPSKENYLFCSPVKDIVVTNDRWGKETTCKNGGFLTCEDRYNPSEYMQINSRF